MLNFLCQACGINEKFIINGSTELIESIALRDQSSLLMDINFLITVS